MRILVIKLSALGDFVQALGPMKSIRHHHPDARITLLTTKLYKPWGEACGYFDEVWLDERPKAWQVTRWWQLRQKLRQGRFERVYDLQTSGRSSRYFALMGKKPDWSGIAPGCSHPHSNPRRNDMHTLDRQAEQLHMAGLTTVFPPDFDWLPDAPLPFDLPERYALLIPGGAPHRPAKRWPAERYADLAAWLVEKGVTPVLIGTQAESTILDSIKTRVPAALNLCQQTSFDDIVRLARKAVCAVGNDTGPMHVCAIAGVPSWALYSQDSNPTLCAQRGNCVHILRRDSLEMLGLKDVIESLDAELGL